MKSDSKTKLEPYNSSVFELEIKGFSGQSISSSHPFPYFSGSSDPMSSLAARVCSQCSAASRAKSSCFYFFLGFADLPTASSDRNDIHYQGRQNTKNKTPHHDHHDVTLDRVGPLGCLQSP
jgi:hypothetical protein